MLNRACILIRRRLHGSVMSLNEVFWHQDVWDGGIALELLLGNGEVVGWLMCKGSCLISISGGLG